MKGSLHTDELLGAVVARETGLRTGRRISHVFIMDVPTYHKVLIVTDAAINIAPTLEDKVDICQNAIDLARLARASSGRRSRSSPRSRPSTRRCRRRIDAAALCKMAERGQITGGAARRPAGVRQRHQQGGRADQGHQVGGRRRSRHPARARSRGRQHAGQAAQLPGQRRQRRPRARRARADHPDEPRRQRAVADRELRASPMLAAHARRQRCRPDACRRSEVECMDDYALVLNAGSSSLKFCVYARPDGGAGGSRRAARSRASARRRGSRRRTATGVRLADAALDTAVVRDGRSALDALGDWLRSTVRRRARARRRPSRRPWRRRASPAPTIVTPAGARRAARR